MSLPVPSQTRLRPKFIAFASSGLIACVQFADGTGSSAPLGSWTLVMATGWQ